MNQFERNRDVKQTLKLGIAEKLEGWMEDSGYEYTDYFHVWQWAIKEEKDFMFPYIVEKQGKKWMGESIVILGMDDNNNLLWESVTENCLAAVEAVLTVPGLFSKEVLHMKYGTSTLEETFKRGDQDVPYRGTNFGQFMHVAMTQAKGDFRLQDALKNYYEDELRKRK